jgi:hypothetical protein
LPAYSNLPTEKTKSYTQVGPIEMIENNEIRNKKGMNDNVLILLTEYLFVVLDTIMHNLT